MTTLQLASSDNGKAFDLTLGAQLVVALEENPTTGYRWSIDPVQPPVIALMGDDYTINAGAGMGGGGVRRFVFRVVEPGETQLSLRLARQWDEQSVARRFVALLRVQ
jgi:inhibitor of cysteine peptidase